MDGLTWGERADMLGIPAHLCAILTSQGDDTRPGLSGATDGA